MVELDVACGRARALAASAASNAGVWVSMFCGGGKSMRTVRASSTRCSPMSGSAFVSSRKSAHACGAWEAASVAHAAREAEASREDERRRGRGRRRCATPVLVPRRVRRATVESHREPVVARKRLCARQLESAVVSSKSSHRRVGVAYLQTSRRRRGASPLSIMSHRTLWRAHERACTCGVVGVVFPRPVGRCCGPELCQSAAEEKDLPPKPGTRLSPSALGQSWYDVVATHQWRNTSHFKSYYMHGCT
jgi:hypothetical protein